MSEAAEILAKEMQAIVAADRWKGRDLSAAPPEKWSHLRAETQQFWIDTASRILAAIQPADLVQAKDAEIARLRADLEAMRTVKRSYAEMKDAAEAERDELRAAIFGGPNYSPRLQNGNFVEMVTSLHAAQQGGLARAEKAEAERDAALAGAVKVKPLVWPDFREGGTCGRPHHFQYFVTQDRHGRFWAHFDMSQHDNLDDAKRHCDRHHQRATLQPDPDARQADLSDAARDVLAERARQISVEGWTPGHDDTHEDGEMAEAAGCYALNAAGWKTEAIRGCWPIKWMAAWFKPTDPRRDLVKAGALCIAEIERLDRALTPPADLAAKIGGAE